DYFCSSYAGSYISLF
nr:immunoglobulin light chain junction region [Macaca mulatta]